VSVIGGAQKGGFLALFAGIWLASACGSSSGSGLFGAVGGPCVTAADCDAHDGQSCDTSIGECIGCHSDLDCDGTHPFCNAATTECVSCRVTADCPANEACQDGECTTRCASSADCSNGHPVCLTDTGACVECVSDADCRADKPGCVLSEHRCRDCSSDAQCSDGKRCAIGKGQCQ
jgi:hypothetical protein